MSKVKPIAVSSEWALSCHKFTFKEQGKVFVPAPTNHVLIFDRSGSMGWTIKNLVDNVCDAICAARDGDTLTVGYFSGEGQYDFPIRNYFVKGDVDGLCKLLKKLASTLNTTCFSEILTKLETVLDEIETVTGNKRFTLTFFTDGCPVVRDVAAEEIKTLKILNDLAPKFSTVTFVGYGGYYNRQLMTLMAKASNGALVHHDDVSDFGTLLQNVMTDSGTAAGHVVDVDSTSEDIVYSLDAKNGTISFYTPDNGKITVNVSETITIYALKKTPSSRIPIVTPSNVAVYYGAAVALSKNALQADALEVLAHTEDMALYRKLKDAFTPTELGQAENAILDAVTRRAARWTTGRQIIKGTEKSFCVLDAIDALCAGGNYWDPMSGDYKLIGRGAVRDETVAKRHIPHQWVEFKSDDVVGNEKRANLSLRAKVLCNVEFVDGGWMELNIPNPFPSYTYQMRAIVVDGNLHTQRLHVKLNNTATHDLFLRLGLLEANDTVLNLSSLPVVTRQMVKDARDARELARHEVELMGTKALLKVWKYYFEQDFPPEDVRAEKLAFLYTPDVVNYLVDHHITDDGFRPPEQTAAVVDYYDGYTLDVRIDKCAALPGFKDVAAKLENGKPLTMREKFVGDAIAAFKVWVATVGKPTKNDYLRKIALIKASDREIRGKIQRIKFGILISREWFTQFRTFTDCKIERDGHTVLFDRTPERFSY